MFELLVSAFSICLPADGHYIISHHALKINAVVTSEIKLKQNKPKTMFCFSEIVLFQFCFSVFTCETKRYNKTKVDVAYM